MVLVKQYLFYHKRGVKSSKAIRRVGVVLDRHVPIGLWESAFQYERNQDLNT